MNASRGFTLIETLIYIAIIGLLAGGLISFTLSIIGTRAKAYVAQEVHSNMRSAVDTISQKIRASTGVNTGASTFDADPGILSLVMADAALDPTIISLNHDNGSLQIKEGAAAPLFITANAVNITNLVFTNMTGASPRENIKFTITIDYNTEARGVDYVYSRSVETAASVRQ